jgi:CRP/FNR family transcriptional regulator, cyclic AMP receptor protein
VILEGEAKVVNASNRVVNRLQPGDSFGEISLLDGGPRTATVIAETPMRVATLERKAFLRTLEAEPAVAVKLLSDAAKLLRRLTRSAAG